MTESSILIYQQDKIDILYQNFTLFVFPDTDANNSYDYLHLTTTF